ncbi:hypothetical protein HAX54_030668 [Datura stramonium]|uniref:Uncharacterized protein n=1 Tax=Datura stramonium TaxID=4076 RepID=A0ABS8VAE6_DATST|nr:hypothetical protein [Datura stramonium]
MTQKGASPYADGSNVTQRGQSVDKAFVTIKEKMPDFNANFMAEGISDHCPVKVGPVDIQRRKRASLKYYNVWATHPNFLKIVETTWKQPIEGYKMWQVVQRGAEVNERGKTVK